MKTIALLALMAASLISSYAHAEHGCQDGYIPVYQGNQQVCVVDYNLPQPSDGNNSDSREIWRETWGAIVVDSDTGNVGTAVGELSREKAEDTASSKCRKSGGLDCELPFAYQNQCAALAWPNMAGGKPTLESGPKLESVKSKALDSCSRLSQGESCKIAYSACSTPIRITDEY